MKYAISILLAVFALSVFGVRISKGITLQQNVTGYLKGAADAGTIELAHGELSKAIDYLERHNLTSGSTSVLWTRPQDEIDFWYQNLKASQGELQKLNSDSPLERTNVLLKLRETLTDSGQKTRVTMPSGLSVYPDNKMWALLVLAAFAALIASVVLAVPTTTADGTGKP